MMLGADFTLEKDFYIDLNEENKIKILETFQTAKSTQLPVIKDDNIVGILDLYSLIEILDRKQKVTETINKDIIVIKKGEDVFNFKNISQEIIPFVNDLGLYIGFIKKEIIQEHLEVEKHEQILEKKYSKEVQYYKDLQEELDAILESSYDGIHVTDENGVTLYFNSACERIEGIDKDNIIGKNMKELVDLGIYSESVALDVLEKKKPITILQRVKEKEIIATGTPIFKDGEMFRVVINSRDITELNNLKKKLHHA